MRAAGVIEEYALFGAIAQMRYTEAVATVDIDVLVMVPGPDRLDVLAGIYEFCATYGYHPEGEAILIGGWPTQFVPVFSQLTQKALELAETTEFEGVPIRVVRADHLAVIALSVGRTKDLLRVLALLESKSVTATQISQIADQHGLGEEWRAFETRFLEG